MKRCSSVWAMSPDEAIGAGFPEPDATIFGAKTAEYNGSCRCGHGSKTFDHEGGVASVTDCKNGGKDTESDDAAGILWEHMRLFDFAAKPSVNDCANTGNFIPKYTLIPDSAS